MTFPTDPLTGRNFDGHYDDRLDCGCTVFYHGGKVPCAEHGPKKTEKRLMTRLKVSSPGGATITYDVTALSEEDRDTLRAEIEKEHLRDGVIGARMEYIEVEDVGQALSR